MNLKNVFSNTYRSISNCLKWINPFSLRVTFVKKFDLKIQSPAGAFKMNLKNVFSNTYRSVSNCLKWINPFSLRVTSVKKFDPKIQSPAGAV